MPDVKIVTTDIPFGEPGRGIFAYRRGDTISAEAVAENGWQEYVAGEKTKSAQAAVAEATGESQD